MITEKNKTTTDIVEIEKKILAILINSATVRNERLMQIKVEDFSQPNNRIVFQAIVDLATNTKMNFDLFVLSNHLKQQNKMSETNVDLYLAQLTELFVSEQFFGQYLQILVNTSTIIQIKKQLQNWSKSSDQAKIHPDKLLKQITMQTKHLVDFHTRNQVVLKPLNQIVNQVVNEWKNFQSDPQKITCSTGFPSLDKKIHGFQKGDLIILAARPSMGKTALALKVAVNNTLDYANDTRGDVIIFSLEMSSYQLVQRILTSHLTEVNLRSLKNTDYFKIDQFTNKLDKTPIFVDTSMAIDVHSIAFKLRAWVQKRSIRLVIIDYLQLLKPVLAQKFDNRNLEIAYWTRMLKEIARELNIPVLCLSQLSRYVDKRDDKRPLLSDLRDSGSIEQDADLVLFLYRADYYLKKDTGKSLPKNTSEPSKTEVIVAKHRNGPTGVVNLLFLPNKVTFYEYIE